MKILLAVDGSEYSDAAVEQVVNRPWPEGTQVKVISAFEMPISPTPETWSIPAEYFNELELAARSRATDAVTSAVEQLKTAKGLTIESEVIEGSPKQVILDEAERWSADLIVVGSHGYRGWERLLLGSVSQAIVSHARCSVEVVRKLRK
jgi:nucleotide-binding universal stress UspA family protein